MDLLDEQNYLITTSNMVFRKSLHARVGGFRPYRYVHDWDFALRAMLLGRGAYIRRFLTAYRIHSHNTILESERKAIIEIEFDARQLPGGSLRLRTIQCDELNVRKCVKDCRLSH